MANTGTATIKVEVEPLGIRSSLAHQLREAADRLDPIDRDEIKAVLVTAGDAPAEQADAVVAYLGGEGVSAAESEAAVQRIADIRGELGAEDFGDYAFFVLGILAHQAPEVVQFVLNQAELAMTK